MIGMKRLLFLLCASLILASSSSAFAEDDGVYKMTVNEDKVINNLTELMYGTNQEWSIDNAPAYYLKEGSLTTDPSFVECYKDMLPLARMAGSSSQENIWKNSLGSMAERKEQTFWNTKGKTEFGIVEWLKAVKAADSTVKLTYTVNITNDTYENMADVIEFLRGDGTINYNGGINWAKERIKYGISEPVDIFCFELGNELDLVGVTDPMEYIRRCKLAIGAIRSVDKTTPISAHVETRNDTKSENYTKWHQSVLAEIGDSLDMISYHNYYPIDKVVFTEKRITELRDDIKKITGSDRIKIYQSEHASQRTDAKNTATYGFVMPHTMSGTLATAEYFLRTMWHPSVIATTYHSTHSSSWCVAYRDNDGIMKRSALGSLLNMFQNYAVGEVVESELEGFKSLEASEFMGQVVKTEKGLNVILANHMDRENTVEFDFNGQYKLVGRSYIQSDDYEADNYIGVKNINVVEETVDSDEVITSYTVPKYCVMVLQLEKTGEVQ